MANAWVCYFSPDRQSQHCMLTTPPPSQYLLQVRTCPGRRIMIFRLLSNNVMQNEAGSDEEEESPQMQLPTDIPWLSHTFPFYTALNESATQIRSAVLASLPDHAKARELVTIYYKHAAFMYVMTSHR